MILMRGKASLLPCPLLSLICKFDKMKFLYLLAIAMMLGICPTLVSAQTKFEKLTFTEALEKAKVENKMVFIDCYTSWCGPCKIMSDKIFPQKAVGEYMNGKFINLKFDMEEGEGVQIAAKFQVTVYPTFLILSPDGQLLHRVVGATRTGEDFVQKIQDGLDENSIINLEKRYLAGERKSEFVVQYIQALKNTGNLVKAREVAMDLLNLLGDKERTSSVCWQIYEDTELSPVGSGNMLYLLRNVARFRANIGEDIVNAKITALFEMQLEDMLRGRNKNITQESIVATEKLLSAMQLQGKDYLFDYIDLIEAVYSGDTEAALPLCEKIFTQMSDQKLSYLYFQPLIALQGKWTDSQKKDLEALTDKLINQVESDVLKDSLKNFKEGMLPKL